jgi:hypothetical protein
MYGESLESQVERLARFILDNVPGEPSEDQGAIDTAIRLLSRHYGDKSGEAAAVQRAVDEATANPGTTVEARGEDTP